MSPLRSLELDLPVEPVPEQAQGRVVGAALVDVELAGLGHCLAADRPAHAVPRVGQQGLNDPKGGGEKYEFSCVTILDYAGNGEFSYQEDVYNPRAGEKVFKRWIAAGGVLPAGSNLV